MVNSYKAGDTVEFPQAGVPCLGKFIGIAAIGNGEYAKVRYQGCTHIVNVYYLKPHGKRMDENNPNRTFRTKKMKLDPLPLTRQALARGRETIERVKEIRMATGIGLVAAKEALDAAESDTQVAIERIKLEQSSHTEDASEDLWELTDNIEEFLDDLEQSR